MGVCGCLMAGTKACQNCSNNCDETNFNQSGYSEFQYKDWFKTLQELPQINFCSTCHTPIEHYQNYCYNCSKFLKEKEERKD